MPTERSRPQAPADLADLLEEGEQVLWWSRPERAAAGRPLLLLVRFGLFWLVVSGAAFWGFGATFLGEEYGGLPVAVRVLLLTLAAAPFAAIGLFAVWGHRPLGRRAADRTIQAVTDRRVILIRPLFLAFGPLTLRSLPRDRARGTTDGEGPSVEVTDARGAEPPIVFRHPAETGGLHRALQGTDAGAHEPADER